MMSAFTLHEHYFDPECSRISSYFCRLFILAGKSSLQYCLLDTERNMMIAMADYRLDKASSKSELSPDELKILFQHDEFLAKSYPAVITGITSNIHTLVPNALYEEAQVHTYLAASFRLEEDWQTMTDRTPELNACNIFAMQPWLRNLIHSTFPDALIVHRSTALLKAASLMPAPTDERPVFLLNIREDYIDICHFKDEMPYFFNSFTVETKEDVLYYTLFVLHQLKMKPDSIHLMLCGSIGEDTEIHKLLLQYLPISSMAFPAGNFNYSPLLKQAGLHRYVELFSLALCGS